MDFELFCSLVNQISGQEPTPQVFLHKDGEPLLHPRIVEMVDYASSRLPHVTLVTNGTLLTEKMAAALLQTKLQEIRFSLEGTDNETYRKVRRQSPDNPHRGLDLNLDYDSVVKKITSFCEMKKNLGTHRPRVGIRTTVFKPTENGIDDVIAFWSERVDYVRAVPILSWSGIVGVPLKKSTLRYPCMHLWESQVISSDGTAVPCCIYVDQTGSKNGHLADVNTDTLASAFVSPQMNRLRSAHLEGDFRDFSFCQNCRDWDYDCRNTEAVWTSKFKQWMLELINGL